MIGEHLKGVGKRLAPARYVNAWWKARGTRRAYIELCRRHGSACVLDMAGFRPPGVHADLGEADESSERPLVLYVGTDWQQDSSGLLKGLGQVADVEVFEGSAGVYGQTRTRDRSMMLSVRTRNGTALLDQVERLSRTRRVDLVVGQMWAFTMDPMVLTTIRRSGSRVVNIAMDDRHAFNGWRLPNGDCAGTLGLVGALDLACTSAPECVDWYKGSGCHAIYFPEASDPDLFRPGGAPKENDVVFVGANYGVRRRLVEALRQKGIAVLTYGEGWPSGRLDTVDMPRLFSASKIVLGCGTIGHCANLYALKLRDFDGPMSGSLYVTHDNPDLRGLYEVGREIVTFHALNEMVDKVRYYLSHEVERETIAAAGRVRAAAEHTWVRRFRLLLASTRFNRQLSAR